VSTFPQLHPAVLFNFYSIPTVIPIILIPIVNEDFLSRLDVISCYKKKDPFFVNGIPISVR
jgi:hypothetical protein